MTVRSSDNCPSRIGPVPEASLVQRDSRQAPIVLFRRNPLKVVRDPALEADISNPFFGSRPESMCLLQLDFTGAQPSSILQSVAAMVRLLERSHTGLRWQVGLGPTLFDRFSALPRPRALKLLRVNGDAAFGLMPNSGQSDVIIAIGEEWRIIIDTARRLVNLLKDSDFRLRDVHIGYDALSDRDHSGFIDGTSNLQELTPEQFAACVFVQPEDDQPFAGGSYLVFRKYEEDLEMWNDLPERVQERFVGRRKKSGSFLNGSFDWTPEARKTTLANAHILCANPRETPPEHPDHWKGRVYRRGLKFTERGSEGLLRYGLLFLAVLRDPEVQFCRLHNERLLPDSGPKDSLLSSGYITPVCSACYYLPPTTHIERS